MILPQLKKRIESKEKKHRNASMFVRTSMLQDSIKEVVNNTNNKGISTTEKDGV